MGSRGTSATRLINGRETPERRLRLLGAFENFRVTLHDLGYHNNVCLLASYQNVHLTHHTLLHALSHAFQQHPALSVQVSDTEKGERSFVRLPFVNLDEVVEFVAVPGAIKERAAWIDHFLSTQNSLGFHDESKPLWRVVVLSSVDNEQDEDSKVPEAQKGSVDIAFVWHHVIGDGKSGLAVHKSILEGLVNISSVCSTSGVGSSPSKMDEELCTLSAIAESPSNDVFPSLEQLFRMPASRSTKFKKWFSARLGIFGSCLPNSRGSRNPDVQKWSGSPYHDEVPIKTLIRHFTIPASSTASLVQLCRVHNTTITAFLQALIGRTISRHYDHEWRLRCATAISMRRFMDPSLNIGEDEMGLWVSAFHFELEARELAALDREKERFWELSRKNRKRIEDEIRKGDTDLGIGALRFIPDFRQNLKAKMGKKREDSFAVTNLGVFDGMVIANGNDGETDREPRIRGMIFTQSCHVNGSGLQFCIMSIMGGEMTIGVSWQDGTVPLKDAECIATGLKAELLKFSEE